MATAIGWWGNWNNATPQPAQKFTPVAFLDGAAKQLTLAGMVYSCCAAGSFGSGLHRKLTEMGVKNFVVQPQKLDELNKDVKPDKTDALLITECFKQHPAHVLFTSLPGAGPKLAPRLLGELIALKTLADVLQALQCLAGMAPVSDQSGKVPVVYLRHQCNRFLRHTIHLWVDISRHYCDWARIYYEAHRKTGRPMPARCIDWVCAGSK